MKVYDLCLMCDNITFETKLQFVSRGRHIELTTYQEAKDNDELMGKNVSTFYIGKKAVIIDVD